MKESRLRRRNRKTKGMEFENILSSFICSLLILVLLAYAYPKLVTSASAASLETMETLNAFSTVSSLVKMCFRDAIEKEYLESCVLNYREKLNIVVTDMFTGESFSCSNAGFLEREKVYFVEFSYPLKAGGEIHPARVRIEFLSITLKSLLPGG